MPMHKCTAYSKSTMEAAHMYTACDCQAVMAAPNDAMRMHPCSVLLQSVNLPPNTAMTSMNTAPDVALLYRHGAHVTVRFAQACGARMFSASAVDADVKANASAQFPASQEMILLLLTFTHNSQCAARAGSALWCAHACIKPRAVSVTVLLSCTICSPAKRN